jgi:hypothetical protein
VSSPLSITLSPTYPGAYESVTAEVAGIEIDTATISWFLDGKSIARGAGLKSVSFETGALGRTMVLQAVAATSRGDKRATKEITPAQVDLVAETNGYAPPFYRGKILNAEESTVRIVALPTFITPSGRELSPSALTYQWTRNGQVVGGASGRGQNVLTVRDLYITGQAKIGVEARSDDGTLVAGSILTLETHDPLLLFYENDPLLGVRYERALGDLFELSKTESTFVAVPYFVSVTRHDDPTLTYAWRLNNEPIAVQESKNAITFRQDGGGGVAEITLTVTRAGSLFERLERAVRVVFSGTP